ncbi:hypothetical protein HPMBJEAJ_00187 [Aeromonas phage avDM6]|nr:hypothetical protein HPMBJEAJ_00187 [Aeromonas phage avDM6]
MEWVGMPAFTQEKQKEYHLITAIEVVDMFSDKSPQKILIRFDNENDLSDFSKRLGVPLSKSDKEIYFYNIDTLSTQTNQPLTEKTKSIWYPQLVRGINADKRWFGDDKQNRYPIYIVSKGRYKNGLTWKALDRVGVDYYVVCEKHELENYSEVVGDHRCLVLPQHYLDEYDTCDDLGDTRSKGPGAARNFCIDHSKQNGFKRHWVMDDNLDDFHRLHNNMKLPVRTPACFRAAEDFVDRFDNVPVSGLNYYSFCKSTDKVNPYTKNTRIYSCLLIENDSGYRWRGRYNEDTDLSLRVLKDGLCTIQFNAFLCGKVTTQRMRGGNSKEFYDEEGTMPKSKMIEDLHPDVAKVVWKFNRWHHHVDYTVYKNLKLNPINPYEKYSDVDDYGMYMVCGVKTK